MLVGYKGHSIVPANQTVRLRPLRQRYIQKLFELQDTTFSDYLRQRRLDRSRLDLCDPRHAADGVAESMYAGTVFLGGRHGELGADAVFEDLTADDREFLGAALERHSVATPAAGFRKLVAGKRLWNFQKSERDLWKSAL